MLRGTTERNASAWADAMDALGAVARLDVGSHAAVFAAQSLREDLGARRALTRADDLDSNGVQGQPIESGVN